MHTNHKNLTYINFNTECVMQWQLLIEEFRPKFYYIIGANNVTEMPYCISLWTIQVLYQVLQQNPFRLDDLLKDSYLLTYKILHNNQTKDKNLQQNLKNDSQYILNIFCRFRKFYFLICHNNKIVVPAVLQKHIV